MKSEFTEKESLELFKQTKVGWRLLSYRKAIDWIALLALLVVLSTILVQYKIYNERNELLSLIGGIASAIPVFTTSVYILLCFAVYSDYKNNSEYSAVSVYYAHKTLRSGLLSWVCLLTALSPWVYTLFEHRERALFAYLVAWLMNIVPGMIIQTLFNNLYHKIVYCDEAKEMVNKNLFSAPADFAIFDEFILIPGSDLRGIAFYNFDKHLKFYKQYGERDEYLD